MVFDRLGYQYYLAPITNPEGISHMHVLQTIPEVLFHPHKAGLYVWLWQVILIGPCVHVEGNAMVFLVTLFQRQVQQGPVLFRTKNILDRHVFMVEGELDSSFRGQCQEATLHLFGCAAGGCLPSWVSSGLPSTP